MISYVWNPNSNSSNDVVFLSFYIIRKGEMAKESAGLLRYSQCRSIF